LAAGDSKTFDFEKCGAQRPIRFESMLFGRDGSRTPKTEGGRAIARAPLCACIFFLAFNVPASVVE
jgi:hypothetical protein